MGRQILTTVVGSYPIPEWLLAMPTEQALRDAMATVFHTQELAGIDMVVDGELYRFDVNHPETNGMIDYFIGKIRNIRTAITRSEEKMFREMAGMTFRAKPAGVVEGQLGEGTLNLVRDYQRARSLTHKPLKFTITSPYMLAKTLVDRSYKSREALVTAIADVLAAQVAEIDADVVQVDEANLTGHPEDAPMVAEAINRIVDGVQKKAAVHLCFGNYGGQSIQKGHWAQLMAFMNSLHVDHVVLEMAFRGYDELAHFKELRPEIGIGLGVVDVKRTVVETPEDIARAIEAAEKIVGKDRITYIHPDCGFWMLKRSIADAKMAALVKGRDLFLGQTR